MATYKKKQQASPETQAEALSISRGIQRPGQTKEQTRLIAQGIQKGIEQYKKQHKKKSRDLDKKQKKLSMDMDCSDTGDIPPELSIHYKQHWLPWALLILTWLGMTAYLLMIKF